MEKEKQQKICWCTTMLNEVVFSGGWEIWNKENK